MKLKKIVLHGFKSFVERTVVNFSEGVTGIVGPNGCGKSNIVDAFRWVFGEQRAKSLRGGKMLDVIFSGTAKRKAHSFAEVTLIFGDVGDALPIPYDEVSVTRRLLRSGESEYKLNGQVVRMKDIHSLFWDSGLGKDAFAIFEQGKIDEVILCSPEERRPIFDQAAGILRFRQRKKEVTRKLTQTEANLARVHDILGEVDKQVKTLQKQMEEAQAYKGNKARLEELERGVLVARFDVADRQRKKLSEDLLKVHQKLEKLSEKRGQEEQRQLELKGALAEKEVALKEATEELYRIRNEREVKSVESEGQQQRLAESEKRKAQIEREIEALDLGDGRAEKGKLAIAEKEWKGAQNIRDRAQQQIDQLHASHKQVQEERVNLVQAAHVTSSALGEIRVLLERGEQRLIHLEEEEDRLQSQVETLEINISAKRKEVAASSKRTDEQKKQLNLVNTQLEARRQGQRDAEAELEQLVRTLADVRARERVLTSLREEQTGFSAASKKILTEGLAAPLFERFPAPKGKEKLYGAVMRAYSHTLVVESISELEEVLEFASDEKLTDFSVATASSVGKIFDEVEEKATLNAKKLPKLTVTPQGHFVDGRGVLFFPTRAEKNTFVREAELKALAKEGKECEGRRKEIERFMDKVAREVGQLQTKQSTLDRELRMGEMKLVEVNFSLQRAIGDLGEGKEKLGNIQEELARLKAESKGWAKGLKEGDKQVEKAEKAVSFHGDRYNSVDGQLEAELKALQEKIVDAREKERIYRELSLLATKAEEAKRQEVRLKESLAQEIAVQKELRKTLTGSTKEVAGHEKAFQKAAARLEALEKEVEKWRGKLEQMESSVEAHFKERHTLESRGHEIEVSIAQKEATASALREEMEERFSMNPEEFEPVKGTLDEAEKEIRRLRKEVERGQNVNLAAIDEFDVQKARSDELTAQVDDLETAKGELLQIIADLDETSRERFATTFEQIRENFQKHFAVLFQGGEADLQFVDSKDPLEAGVDIMAKPPGKKMRSITLLSGGEKCLTAMALLFAVFEVQPAPFCILDEMDAPLDDANITRFLEVLKPFMDQTQFIIVTHNKRTMAVADILFGVSMEERGVSKLLSLKFEKEPVAC